MTAKNLPTWLQDLLPAPAEPGVIDVLQEGNYEAQRPTGENTQHASLEEAYDALREEGLDVCFTEAVAGDDDDVFVTVEAPGSYGRLLLSFTEEDHLHILEGDYAEFLKAAALLSQGSHEIRARLPLRHPPPRLLAPQGTEDARRRRKLHLFLEHLLLPPPHTLALL